MTQAGDAVTVIDNVAQDRFEVTVEGHRAELVYRRVGHQLVLVHTEVPAELGGRGIGGTLVGTAVDAAAAGDLTVVPVCSFAASWLGSHPDAAARVRIDWPEE